MPKDIEFPPLIHWKSLLKGILGGSLLVGGLANSYGLVIQPILAIIGLLILIDGLMVTGKGVFIAICMTAAIISGAVTLVLSLAGFGTPYLAAIFAIAVLAYAGRFLKPARKLAESIS